MDSIFLLSLLVCAILLATGRPLNINITHTHRVDEKPKSETSIEQEREEANEDEDKKEISEFLQKLWGVANEE